MLFWKKKKKKKKKEKVLLPSIGVEWNDLERTSGQVTLRFRLMSS